MAWEGKTELEEAGYKLKNPKSLNESGSIFIRSADVYIYDDEDGSENESSVDLDKRTNRKRVISAIESSEVSRIKGKSDLSYEDIFGPLKEEIKINITGDSVAGKVSIYDNNGENVYIMSQQGKDYLLEPSVDMLDFIESVENGIAPEKLSKDELSSNEEESETGGFSGGAGGSFEDGEGRGMSGSSGEGDSRGNNSESEIEEIAEENESNKSDVEENNETQKVDTSKINWDYNLEEESEKNVDDSGEKIDEQSESSNVEEQNDEETDYDYTEIIQGEIIDPKPDSNSQQNHQIDDDSIVDDEIFEVSDDVIENNEHSSSEEDILDVLQQQLDALQEELDALQEQNELLSEQNELLKEELEILETNSEKEFDIDETQISSDIEEDIVIGNDFESESKDEVIFEEEEGEEKIEENESGYDKILEDDEIIDKEVEENMEFESAEFDDIIEDENVSTLEDLQEELDNWQDDGEDYTDGIDDDIYDDENNIGIDIGDNVETSDENFDIDRGEYTADELGIDNIKEAVKENDGAEMD